MHVLQKRPGTWCWRLERSMWLNDDLELAWKHSSSTRRKDRKNKEPNLWRRDVWKLSEMWTPPLILCSSVVAVHTTETNNMILLWHEEWRWGGRLFWFFSTYYYLVTYLNIHRIGEISKCRWFTTPPSFLLVLLLLLLFEWMLKRWNAHRSRNHLKALMPLLLGGGGGRYVCTADPCEWEVQSNQHKYPTLIT